ncbi:DegV family protein [Alkalihalobacillus oceani]|uniref:DegV family protein n=1 Tax=Halalkalibacter oceani TaxID=1653776 RepID=UPI00203BBE9A|nr:DegV family protein [Halalkalibacter oceani]MCM3760920.1 DegV family protein [Halalkalibacter oceani]
MNKNVAIVTDSTAYLPKEERERLSIYMVPLSVIFAEKTYKEELELTTEEFYKKLEGAEQLPTTSQPSTGQFVELFTDLKKQGYQQVVTLHLSSGISGTFQNALTAGEMVDGLEVHGFDSEIACYALGFFVREAAQLALKGAGVSEIVTRLEEIKATLKAYFMVADLGHLHRGGRLSGGQLLVGNLLKIKPILHFVDGKIVPFEKVRTEKKAIDRILQLLDQDLRSDGRYEVTVIHAMRPEAAEQLAADIRENYDNVVDVVISVFGPVIGTHLGPGSLGISWYKQAEA